MESWAAAAGADWARSVEFARSRARVLHVPWPCWLPPQSRIGLLDVPWNRDTSASAPAGRRPGPDLPRIRGGAQL